MWIKLINTFLFSHRYVETYAPVGGRILWILVPPCFHHTPTLLPPRSHPAPCSHSPVCRNICSCRWENLVKFDEQIWQRKGLAPVCVIMWTLTWPETRKYKVWAGVNKVLTGVNMEQMWQRKGLAPVCVIMCTLTWPETRRYKVWTCVW